jgi:hypothetical protein
MMRVDENIFFRKATLLSLPYSDGVQVSALCFLEGLLELAFSNTNNLSASSKAAADCFRHPIANIDSRTTRATFIPMLIVVFLSELNT